MKMKLMLVDDHRLFLDGLKYLLETNGIEVAGIAYNGREALVKARILKPDIILMDIKMPGYSGIDTLKLIKAEMKNVKVVMLTTSDEDEDLFDSIKYGASGYLLKNTNAAELINMLSDLERDEVPLSPGLAARILEEFRRRGTYESKEYQNEENNKEVQLTQRQLEVLEMVGKGMTYMETGEALGLTERTVKYHMGRIIDILHLENRAQVIAYAAHMGLIENIETID